MPFPVDIKYISETEQTCSVFFPEKFKQKMMIENGGDIITEDDDWQLFPFLDKTDNKRISRTCNDIILETINAREWDNFPQNAFAIASNGMGDKLILLPSIIDSKKLEDKIYIWLHETGEIEEMASSIDELI
jgi:hypothetical protein